MHRYLFAGMLFLSLWGSPADAASPAPIWYWMDGYSYAVKAPSTRAGLQAALDLATSSRMLNIQIGGGQLDLDSVLWVHGNTSIRGAGKGITVFKRSRFSASDPTNQGHIIVSAKYGLHATNNGSTGGGNSLPTDSLTNITIADLTIDGNYTAWPSVDPNTPGNMGLQFWYVDGVLLQNVEIKNTLQTGLELDACRNGVITGLNTYKTGQQLNLGSRNAINLNNNSGSLNTTYNWGKRFTITSCDLEEHKDTGIDCSNVSQVTISNIHMKCTHDSLYGNFAFEWEGDIAGYTRKSFSISNVICEGLTGSFFTNNATVGNLEDVSISNCIFRGSAANHRFAAINVFSASGTNSWTRRFSVTNCRFINLNSANGDGTPFTQGFVYAFNPTGVWSRDITFTDCTFEGAQGGTYHSINDAVRLGGKVSNVVFRNVKLFNAEAYGFNLVAGANDTLRDVALENCYVDNAQDKGFIVETAGGPVNGIRIQNCVAKDVMKNAAGTSISVFTYATGQKISNVTLSGNSLIRTSGSNMQGIQVTQFSGAAPVDSIWLINNDVGKAASNPYYVTGTPTHVYFDDVSSKIAPAILAPTDSLMLGVIKISSAGGNALDIQRADGTLVIRIDGGGSGINVTNGGKYVLGGYQVIKDNGNARQLVMKSNVNAGSFAVRDSGDASDIFLVGTNGRTVARDSLRANLGLYLGGRFIPKHDGNSATLNFGAPGAVPGSVDLTITVNGAAFGNRVAIGSPITIGANYILTGFVSAANTVTIRWTQIAGAAADPDGGGGTYTADIIQ